MVSRRIAECWLLLALVLASSLDARGAQPLPELDSALEAEPLAPMVPISDEAGFFARWRADHQARAARDGWIETDRPSFTISSATVPQGWLQAETGYVYAMRNNPHSVSQNPRHVLPELTLRYGLFPRLELRASWMGMMLFEDTNRDPLTTNIQVGLKYQVSNSRGWIPQSALLASLFVPNGDGAFLPVPSNAYNRNNHVAPLLDYIYTWSLSERWSLGGSTGAVFDVYDEFDINEFFQSAIVRFNWTPKWMLFFEGYAVFGQQPSQRHTSSGWYGLPSGFSGVYFGSLTTSYSSATNAEDDYVATYLDSGVLWRPLANVQFDWRAGLGLNDDSDSFFTGVGASVRY
jgi:hypothetical protein